MDKPKNSAINLLTECLAAMTYRAIEAERELEEVRETSNMWFLRYKESNAQLEAANHEITALIEKLAAAEKEQEGAPDSGESE